MAVALTAARRYCARVPVRRPAPPLYGRRAPFPGVAALLLHRIKADLAAEKRRHHLDLAATSTSASASASDPEEEARGSGAAAFAPAQMAEITQIVRVVEEVLGSQACRPLHCRHPYTVATP